MQCNAQEDLKIDARQLPTVSKEHIIFGTSTTYLGQPQTVSNPKPCPPSIARARSALCRSLIYITLIWRCPPEQGRVGRYVHRANRNNLNLCKRLSLVGIWHTRLPAAVAVCRCGTEIAFYQIVDEQSLPGRDPVISSRCRHGLCSTRKVLHPYLSRYVHMYIPHSVFSRPIPCPEPAHHRL